MAVRHSVTVTPGTATKPSDLIVYGVFADSFRFTKPNQSGTNDIFIEFVTGTTPPTTKVIASFRASAVISIILQ